MLGLKKISSATQRWWGKLSTGQRIALGTLSLFFVFAAAYIGYTATAEDYVPAFTGLKPEVAAKITGHFDEKKIPYQLEAGGTTILVRANDQHMARLAVAGDDSLGGGVGYELFDKPHFGMTSFEKQMNYRRALQGELRRTIISMNEVEDARVHIVLPKKATFREDDQEATASVALNLKGKLDKPRIQGIVNLVASSVEGLKPGNVTVVDQKSNVLSASSDPSVSGAVPALEYRNTVESKLQKQILAILDPAVGTGNSKVRVSADMDFRKIEQVEEIYDKENSVVISEHSESSTSADPNAPAQGVAGAQANQGAGAAAGNNQNNQNMRQVTTKNIQTPVKRIKVEEPVGRISRLNIAVAINGTYEGEGDAQTYVPRTPEELTKFEDLIKAAVGYDESRGDSVVVRDLPFVNNILADAAPIEDSMLTPDVWKGIRYGGALLMAVMLLVFLVRPLVKVISSVDSKEESTNAIDNELVVPTPVSIEGIEGIEQIEGLHGLDKASPRLLAVEFAGEHPRKTAQILRTWLLEDGNQGDGDFITEKLSARSRDNARA